MQRLKRAWRWWVVLAVIAVLVGLPTVIQRLPADADAVPPAELAARIAASTDRPYSGSVETVGSIGLPDIPGVEDAVGLLGGTSRLRAWVAGPTSWRVDVLTFHGEFGTYRDANGITTWDAESRRMERIEGPEGAVRLPRAADMLPPELARRLLAGTDPSELQPLESARVTGRGVPGLRIDPADPASTVEHIDIWADPDTGIALRVNVVAKSTGQAALRSQFLDVSQSPVSADLVTYEVGPNIRPRRNPSTDLIDMVTRFNAIPLPGEIGGLPQREESVGAISAYGTGFHVVAAMALPAGFLERAIPSTIPTTTRPWGGTARVIETPLVNAMGFTAGFITYVLAGPVTVGELDRLAAELTGAPPA